MLGMKNHFDISGSIEIREVDIAGVACINFVFMMPTMSRHVFIGMGFYVIIGII